MSEPGEEQTFGGEFGPSFVAEPGTSPVAEPEAEVLSLVFKDVPEAVKAGDIEEGMSQHERMSRLNMRRESLKFVLSRTISNLAHFIDQCRSNPSCEVEGLARFHQDRLMQVQVELKSVRQEIKKLHRARLQPVRSRRYNMGVTCTSPMMQLLDRHLYSDMIFPLIVAADGDRARNLPQVCTTWRSCFEQGKVNWSSFAVTQAIRDLAKLYNVLGPARRLRSLRLVCQQAPHLITPHALCSLLTQLSLLTDLVLISPGAALTSAAMHRLPSSLTHLRIHSAPELDVHLSHTIASRVPGLRALQLLDVSNLTDDGMVALVSGALKTSLEELDVSGCRSMRGNALRDICNLCPSLKKLHLSRSSIRAGQLEGTSKLTQLELLSVTSSARSDTTPLLNVARSCRALKSLILYDIGPLQDEAVMRVLEEQPGLTTLILGPCTALTEVFISGLVLKIPSLTHLALAGCSLLSDSALLCVAEALPNLKHLLMTESAGFGDAGIFALESCTQLQQLTLHPLNHATSSGLIALCDYCDALEYVLLGHCPPVGEETIMQMIGCCLRLKVLMMTHVTAVSHAASSYHAEAMLHRLLEASDVLQCLVLLPPPSSTSIDFSNMVDWGVLSRVHRSFPDAVVISEWEDFEVILEVLLPALDSAPDLRHAVLQGLFAGGRQSYISADEPTLTARRLVQDLLRRTRHPSSAMQGVAVSKVQQVQLLKEALAAELGAEEELQVHSRVLFEAEADLESLAAAALERHVARTRPSEGTRKGRRNLTTTLPLTAPGFGGGGWGVHAGDPMAAAAMGAATQTHTQTHTQTQAQLEMIAGAGTQAQPQEQMLMTLMEDDLDWEGAAGSAGPAITQALTMVYPTPPPPTGIAQLETSDAPLDAGAAGAMIAGGAGGAGGAAGVRGAGGTGGARGEGGGGGGFRRIDSGKGKWSASSSSKTTPSTSYGAASSRHWLKTSTPVQHAAADAAVSSSHPLPQSLLPSSTDAGPSNPFSSVPPVHASPRGGGVHARNAPPSPSPASHCMPSGGAGVGGVGGNAGGAGGSACRVRGNAADAATLHSPKSDPRWGAGGCLRGRRLMDQRPVPESARMFSSHTELAYSGGEGASSVSKQQGRHVGATSPASPASGWSGGGYAVASSPAAARASSVDAVAHGGMRSSRLGYPQQHAEAGAAAADDAPGWDGEQGDRDECLEEWAVKRFQRLFPERISARLVTHAMGRRATEAALCNTIIDTYHRLLREAATAAPAPALNHQEAPDLPNHLLEQEVPMLLESADAGAQGMLHFMEVEDGASTSASGGAAAGSMDTESEGMFFM